MDRASSDFASIALSKTVVARAVKVTLVVGTLLALINHGDAILALSVTSTNLGRILLTYAVPYCVSTYSSVRAIQSANGQ